MSGTGRPGAAMLSDGRVAERYSTSSSPNQTTEVVVIEELTNEGAGVYTCVFDGLEHGTCFLLHICASCLAVQI